jgi:hypothetical protein
MTKPVRSQTVLAYWLLPAAPARDFFRAAVDRLARECDAPNFEPHLTLTVGPDSAADAHRVLTGIAAGPIELHAAGIHFATKFTKTLFVQFNSSPELDRLRDSLGLERRDNDPFDPHVSLLYKSISVEKQSQLAAAMKLPFQTVWFDAIQAVRCRVPVVASADVAAWEVLASLRLALDSVET